MASLEQFAHAVERHNITFYRERDDEIRMRGARELYRIERIKKVLGPANEQVCRDIWNAKVDRTFKTPREREQFRWREGPVTIQHANPDIEFYNGVRLEVREQLERSERWGWWGGKFWEGTYEKAGRLWEYVMGALWDGYRRCLDEGWFGKTTYDWMTERHYKTNQMEKFSPIYSGPDWEAKREEARESILQQHYGEQQERDSFRGQGIGI